MVAAMLGKPLMEWQQHVADIILEIDPETGRLAYDEWILTVPRQSGKSTFILAKFVHRCSATKFFGPRQRLAYTAQTRQKAREKWEEDYVAELEHSAKFRSRITTHKGNGNEHVRFSNGSRFGIEANTEKAGHGGTLDEAYIDEAFAQVDNRIEQAFGPAMITRANKQLGVVSTAGWLDGSPYLLEKVEIGRQLVADDVRSGTAYFEWSAPDDADPSDETVWLGCMPAVHRPDCGPKCKAHTVTLAAIRAEYQKAQRSGKLSDFCRAYLNQWKRKPREAEETALGNWGACALREAIVPPKPAAIGVAISVDQAWASIGSAGLLDEDRLLVGAVDRFDLTSSERGRKFLISEVARIQRDHGCDVVVDEKGPASDLIADLVEAGVRVTPAKLNDYIEACADMRDRVRVRTVTYMPNPDLDSAATAARWRDVGDRRVFGRKQSAGDISMLEAVTLAGWVTTSARESVYEQRGMVTL